MKERFAASAGAGLGWGLGLGLALGLTGVLGGRGVRPALKSTVKGGLAAAESGAYLLAEARERAEDLYHEARAERAAEREARERAALLTAPISAEV